MNRLSNFNSVSWGLSFDFGWRWKSNNFLYFSNGQENRSRNCNNKSDDHIWLRQSIESSIAACIEYILLSVWIAPALELSGPIISQRKIANQTAKANWNIEIIDKRINWTKWLTLTLASFWSNSITQARTVKKAAMTL